jgi:hypothetical protein
MLPGHGQQAAPGMDWSREIAISPAAFREGKMNSWYIPAIPAALALSVIAYCFSVAY